MEGAWQPSPGLRNSVAGALGAGPGDPAPGRGCDTRGETAGVCGGVCIIASEVGRVASAACCASTAEDSCVAAYTLPTRWWVAAYRREPWSHTATVVAVAWDCSASAPAHATVRAAATTAC